MPRPASPPKRLLFDRMFQMRLSVFALTVAGCALICWAVLYYRANMSPTRAMFSYQLGNLTSSDPKERRMAARQLDGIPVAMLNDGARALLVAMRDPDAEVRAAAAFSLSSSLVQYFVATGGEVPPPLDAATLALISAMNDPEPAVRISASIGLNLLSQTTMVEGGKTKMMGLNPSIAVPAMIKALDDRNLTIALQVLRSLKLKGTDLTPVLPVLRWMSHEADPLGRAEAIGGIAMVVRSRGESVGEILGFLDDEDIRVREAAVKALHDSSQYAEEIALALAKRLDRSAPGEQAAIVQALSTIRNLPSEVVPPLVRVLENENKDVGRPERANIAKHAALAIAHAPPSAAQTALPALTRHAKTGNVTAAEVLVKIAPDSKEADSIVAPLALMVSNLAWPSVDRMAAANVLASLGPRAAEAAPTLLKAAIYLPMSECGQFSEDDLKLPPIAAHALGSLGPKAAFAAPMLAQYIEKHLDSPDFPREHLDALISVAPNSAEVANILMEMAAMPLDEGPPGQKVHGYLRSLNGNKLRDNPTLRAAQSSEDAERRARAKAAMKELGIQ